MNKRVQYLVKNLGILTISNFASKILVFLLVPLYTSVLSTSEYGIYDLIVSTATLLYPILSVNIVDAVMRYSMDKACSKEEIVSIGIKYITFSIIIVGGLLCLTDWFDLFSGLEEIRVYFFFYYLFFVLNQFFIQFTKGLELVKDMAIAGLIGTVVMIVFNIVFLLVFRWGILGFLIATILAQAIPVFYFIIRLKFWIYLKKFSGNKQLEIKMLRYCIPLICSVLGWWVNSTADKFAVTFICGVAANGIFSVSYKIPSILNTFQSIFTQAWQISAIREYGEEDVAVFYGKAFNYINVIMCVACSFLIILTKPLAYLMYSNEFYDAWKYVPILLVSSVLNSASGFIGPILSAKKDSKQMALSAVYGTAINILLNIVLIYLMGVQGATIATLISSYVIYIVRKHAVNEELKIDAYWKVLLTWLLLVLQAIIEIKSTMYYLEIVIMVILLVINWSVLYKAINSLRKRKSVVISNE